MIEIEETQTKTWFIDLDGTVLEHRTNKEIDDMVDNQPGAKEEKFLPNALNFFRQLPKRDIIILTTARLKRHITHTLKFLDDNYFPYDEYIFGLGSGQRILLNDIKPAEVTPNKRDMKTAFAVNLDRDKFNFNLIDTIVD